MRRSFATLLFTVALTLHAVSSRADVRDDVFGYTPTPTLWSAAELGDADSLRRLLQRGGDVSVRDAQGLTPLYIACREGQLETARLLLEAGAPVNAECGQGDFPINVAAHSGNVDLVKMLLEQGAYVEQPGQFGGRPLSDAACSGSLAMARFLLSQGAEIDAYDSDYRSALSYACLFDRPDARKYQSVVRTLLDARANANLGAGEFDTPITYALMQANPSTLELLLNHGADPNVKNSWGLTPLHFAGKYRNRAAVPILLAHGARVEDIYQAAVADNVAIAGKLLREGVNVKVKDWQGETPLDWAVGMGSARVAALLISHPEQSGVTVEQAQSAIETAAANADSEVIEAIFSTSRGHNLGMPAQAVFAAAKSDSMTIMVQLLIRGYDPLAEDSEGRTPLHVAAAAGSLNVARALLRRFSLAQPIDYQGITPLHLAAENGDREMIALLLEYGANPSAQDNAGSTPLHYLCLHASGRDEDEYIAAASLLLEAGAEVNALNARGFAPVDYTMPFKDCGTGEPMELQRFLAEHGAHPSERWLQMPNPLGSW